jgi:lysophospholipase L1-like esterase
MRIRVIRDHGNVAGLWFTGIFSVLFSSVHIGIAQPITSGSSILLSTSITAESISPPPPPGKWQALWIDRVTSFIDENQALDPNQRNIVFVGDSLTQGFKLKDHFPALPVLNRGISSDGTCDFPEGRNVWRGVTRRMKESIYDCNPSHLFILIGTNDIGVTNIPLDYWLGSYKYIISQTRQKFPDVKIIAVTCPPTGEAYARNKTFNPRVVQWNALIREYATKENLRLIDLYELLKDSDGMLTNELTRDGLHFNQTGYDRWAEAIRKILTDDGITTAPAH